jgi:hypothetical protein
MDRKWRKRDFKHLLNFVALQFCRMECEELQQENLDLWNQNAELRDELGAAKDSIKNMVDMERCRHCNGPKFG